jgi:hypothetical protein
MSRWVLATVVLIGFAWSAAGAAEPPARAWRWPWCAPTRPCPCCPDDYCPKPLPTVCPVRCFGPDDYCPKALPCVCPCNCKGPDDYCPKKCPLWLPPCYPPWYVCVPAGNADAPGCACGKNRP